MLATYSHRLGICGQPLHVTCVSYVKVFKENVLILACPGLGTKSALSFGLVQNILGLGWSHKRLTHFPDSGSVLIWDSVYFPSRTFDGIGVHSIFFAWASETQSTFLPWTSNTQFSFFIYARVTCVIVQKVMGSLLVRWFCVPRMILCCFWYVVWWSVWLLRIEWLCVGSVILLAARHWMNRAGCALNCASCARPCARLWIWARVWIRWASSSTANR